MMKFFIFLLIFGIAAGNVYRQPLTRVESRKTKMMKDGTWDAYFKQKQLYQQSRNFTADLHFRDYDEAEYVAKIFIGTPPQAFKVFYDLTKVDLWVPDITCGEQSQPSWCPYWCLEPDAVAFCDPLCYPGTNSSTATSKQICDQKVKYSSTKSTTFSLTNKLSYSAREYEFGYVDSTNSFWGQDKIMLGGKKELFKSLSVPSSLFSQIKAFSPVFYNTPFDGILGFQIGGFTQVLYNATVLDENILTIYLHANHNNKYDVTGGYVTYGELDKKHCSSEVMYDSVSGSRNDEFPTSYVAYGSVSIQRNPSITIDLSRTSIYGPEESIKKIKDIAGADEDGTIDCDAKIEDITLPFGYLDDSKILTIPAKNLIIHNDDGSCQIALESMPFFADGRNQMWIFGTPLFRSYCYIFGFELDNEKMGFAKVIA